MRTIIMAVAGVVLALAPAHAEEPAVPVLDGPSFQRWLDFVVPKPSEQAWAAIAWRPQLWTAIQEAVAARKPILVWAMNGHPMACT